MLANRIRGSVYRKKEQIPQIPSYYVTAQDSDFEGTRDNSFRYIGTDEYVIIPNIIKGVAVTSYYAMFSHAKTQLKGVASFNKNVTVMTHMFSDSKTTTLDLSFLNTSNVTNMSYMFIRSQVRTLDVLSFDTSNVTDMRGMFRNSQARTLDLSSFDTSKVTQMFYMFTDSQARTVYARTRADVYKFNGSFNVPSHLKFVVKP